MTDKPYTPADGGALELLDDLRWAPDRIVTNHENERVWLKKIEGGITDCCLASEPCKFHGSLTHQASKGKQ